MSEDFLIDTNIISEISRKNPNPDVVSFIANQQKISVSTILFHELTFGLETADHARKSQLTQFLLAMRRRFGAQAIPVDLEIAETAGRLRAFEKKQGRILTLADALMAATAMVRGKTLVTRNIRDFANLGIKLKNPFSE